MTPGSQYWWDIVVEGGTLMNEIRIRFNPVMGVLVACAGGMLALLGMTAGPSYQIGTGTLFVVLGVLMITGTCVVVAPDLVQVKNPLRMTLKRVPVHGLHDLRLDNKKLHRASDGKKIVSLGLASVRNDDVDVLRQAITAASYGSPPQSEPPTAPHTPHPE